MSAGDAARTVAIRTDGEEAGMAGGGHVAYFALGGAISMHGDHGTAGIARLGGEELLADVGELPVEVRTRTPYAVPSASLTFTDVLDVVEQAGKDGADGRLGMLAS